MQLKIRCGIACPAHPAEGPCPFVARGRAKDEVLYVGGESAERIWFVKSGVVVLARDPGDEARGPVAWTVRQPGAFFGLESINASSYLDTACAASPVLVCSLGREQLNSWLTAAAAKVLSRVVDSHAADVGHLIGGAVARSARWLLDPQRVKLTNTIPRRVVADLLRMQPETLSRALGQLAAAGGIDFTRTTITVLDTNALERAAGRPRPRDQNALVTRSPALAASFDT
jgi:CRP-like cAMP-binding protein